MADRDVEARLAAQRNTGAFTELPSYTQQTGRDIPTSTGTPFGQASPAAPSTSNEYQSVVNEVNKTIKDAEKTLALAKKSGNKKDIAAAQGLVDLSKGQLNDLVKLAGSLGGSGGGSGALLVIDQMPHMSQKVEVVHLILVKDI